MFCKPCLLEWDGRVAAKCPSCQNAGEKGKGGPEYKIVKLSSGDDGTVFFDIKERTKSALEEVDQEEFIGNTSLHDLDDKEEELKGEKEGIPVYWRSLWGS